MVRIEIPLPTPSLNRYKRMHWGAQKRLRDQYETLIRHQMRSLDRARPHQFRRVKIERYGSRLLDVDNFVGGCKPLIDALSRAGIIWDDSIRYVRVDYEQIKATAKTARTIVTIT